MKKSILFLFSFLLLFAITDLKAQDDGLGGIRIGYHSPGFYSDGNQFESSLNNFYVGFFRDNKLVPAIHLGTGLEYFQNGWKTDDDNMRQLHTLSIPVHAKFKIGPVFALGGIAANIKVSEKLTTAGSEVELSDDLKASSFDLPLVLGAGVKFLFITVEVRYHWGTMEVVDGYKSQYLQIGAGFSL